MGRDHIFDPSPKTASITELEHLPIRAGDIALQHKKQKQSTKWLEYAEGTHGVGGTYPPWDERACELHHSPFIPLKMEVRLGRPSPQYWSLRLPTEPFETNKTDTTIS